MSTSRKLTAYALAAVIFAAGAVVGAVVHRHVFSPVYNTGPHFGGSHEHRMQVFRHHLGLTDEQAHQIEAIMERTRTEAEAIRAEEQPRMHELHERAQREIRAVLTEEQAAEYERIIEHTHRVEVPSHKKE